MPADLVVTYGGMEAARAAVDSQLATVNAAYATQFDKPVRWRVKDFYSYSQSADLERLTPLDGADYHLIYSENTLWDDGGWVPSSRSIVIRWTPAAGGVFGPYGADSLIHELGHARGAVDLYALGVTGSNNPVNGQGFVPPSGFMTYPYGASAFDTYSENIVNASGSLVYDDDHVVMQSLPSTYRLAVTRAGAPVAGASVTLYPVPWFSSSVSPTPHMSGTTGEGGTWVLPDDPFDPSLSWPKWHLRYPSFLVEVVSGASVGYGWLTLHDAGNAFFAGQSAYQLSVSLPIVSQPGAQDGASTD
jgi:hypothetical protein